MSNSFEVPRRTFLKSSALAAAPLLAGGAAFAQESARPRVVHVHHGRAVTWSRGGGYYRDAVHVTIVQAMLDEAVQLLKGGDLTTAWRRVFALSGNDARKLAIKVSCNNSYTAAGCGNETDAIPEPAIAAIRGFVRAGGRAANVTLYDATTSNGARAIPTWFRDRVLAAVPGVQFLDKATAKGGTYSARTHVTWSAGYGSPPPATRIADVALKADYLVNIPLVRRHVGAGASLGYKNHFGSIENVHLLHPYVWNDYPTGSVLADVLGSPSVPGDPTVRSLAKKTVLTIGDLLLGQPCKNYGLEPVPWQTFRKEWPNSLVVGDDPVAADSVMLDLLAAEPAAASCGQLAAWGRRYLSTAEARGQGVYETVPLAPGALFDPKKMTYKKIDYRHLDLQEGGADLRVSRVPPKSAKLEWTHYFAGVCEVRRASLADFSDAVLLTTTSANSYVDNATVPRAYYKVNFVG